MTRRFFAWLLAVALPTALLGVLIGPATAAPKRNGAYGPYQSHKSAVIRLAGNAATSQAAINISGEYRYPVAPLPLPGEGEDTSTADAVMLFALEGRRAPYPKEWAGQLGELEPLILGGQVALRGDVGQRLLELLGEGVEHSAPV